MNTSFPISSGAVSDRGLSEKRPQNEDSYLDMAKCGIFAVADGVGGAQAGEVASQMAMEILAEAFSNRPAGEDAESVMRTAIERANAAIYQMSRELSQLANMATTIVALHLDGNIATIGHVGDSRLYRVDRDGTLYPETEDHSMVADEVRAGRMTVEQAENHPSRNIINRALGAESVVDVDLKTIMIEPGTSFLICSDGITRHVSDQEIRGVLTFGGDPLDVCDYLKNLCYNRGAEDNLTAVVVKVAAAEIAAAAHMATPVFQDNEEPTLATARAAQPFEVLDDDDELLELGSIDTPVRESTISEEIQLETLDMAAVPPALNAASAPFVPKKESIQEPAAKPVPDDTFSMFGESSRDTEDTESKGFVGKVAAALGLLLLGAAAGFGVYHYVVAPATAEPPAPQLSVMKADNIPLSAFEENRRNVDADPAGYITKYGTSPQDSEDYYLLGRAYLLSGEYLKARQAMTEAQTRLSEADPVNTKVLASDIAVALAVTKDTTIQSMLKKELAPQTSPNLNANR